MNEPFLISKKLNNFLVRFPADPIFSDEKGLMAAVNG
jgi:hypothetical protein